MQLIARRTAQEYNQRKDRKGAFWEDRYHATAVDTQDYLARCMVYIDLNMVRAGVVATPEDWQWSGYYEIQHPPQRYAVIDTKILPELFDIACFRQYQKNHKGWVETALETGKITHESSWSQALAVGSRKQVETVKATLGVAGKYRTVVPGDKIYTLKEPVSAYRVHLGGKKRCLRVRYPPFPTH